MPRNHRIRVVIAIAIALSAWLLTSSIDATSAALGMPSEAKLFAHRLAQSALWLASAHLINIAIEAFFWRGLVEKALARTPPRLVVQIGHLLVLLIAMCGIVGFVFEQPITGLWATSGAVGIVVGLALRNLILDTFSGMAINIEQPFKVGDWISCHTAHGTYVGRVVETNWRTTRLQTSVRNIIVVPNSLLTSTIVTNYSMPSNIGGFEVSVVLDFSVPTERVLRILTAAVQQSVGKEGITESPRPEIDVAGVTNDGVEYKIKYSIQLDRVSPGRSKSFLLRTVIAHLRNAGLSLTHPRRDVFIAKMPWRQRDWHYGKDQIRQLSQMPLFSALSPIELEELSAGMAVFSMQQGEIVVTQGDTGDSMFVLAEGLLRVSVTHENGTELRVAELGPGDFFGERSLLTGEIRSATVVCAADSVVCEIAKDAIAPLLLSNPSLAQAFSHTVVNRELQNGDVATQSRQRDFAEKMDAETGKFLKRLRQFFGI